MFESNPIRHGSRYAQRVRLEAMIEARAGQHRLHAQVLDISATGVRLRTLNPLRVGSKYWIKVPPVEPQEAQVMWVDQFVSGCAFVRPLHSSVFEMLIEAQARQPEPVERRTIRSL